MSFLIQGWCFFFYSCRAAWGLISNNVRNYMLVNFDRRYLDSELDWRKRAQVVFFVLRLCSLTVPVRCWYALFMMQLPAGRQQHT